MSLKDVFRLPATLTRYRLPPLGPHMDGFCDWLHRQGFSLQVIERRVRQATHFSSYLRREGVEDCQDVEGNMADRFIHEHLPHCRCRGPWSLRQPGAPTVARSFIDYLSEQDVLPSPAPAPPPHAEPLQRYLDYLKHECELAERTIKAHCGYLTPFLRELGSVAEEDLHHLQPEQVLAYFARYNQDRGPNQCRQLQGVLRSFFRFSLRSGYFERDLAEAIPSMRTYKLSGLPLGVSEDEAQRILERVDFSTPAGLRDFAILQLLDTYGVRGGQVRALRLQDIRWRESQIRFPPHKGGKEVIDPLTVDVGESLLEYLRHARPQAPYPEVFLTARPPFRPLRSPSTLSSMVAKRLRRAGVNTPKAATPTGSAASNARPLRPRMPNRTMTPHSRKLAELRGRACSGASSSWTPCFVLAAATRWPSSRSSPSRTLLSGSSATSAREEGTTPLSREGHHRPARPPRRHSDKRRLDGFQPSPGSLVQECARKGTCGTLNQPPRVVSDRRRCLTMAGWELRAR